MTDVATPLAVGILSNSDAVNVGGGSGAKLGGPKSEGMDIVA